MANLTTNALFDSIQTKLSGVSYDQVKVELFNTVDEVCREALRIQPPLDINAEPSTWLSGSHWLQNYQCLMEGTIARLYGQVGRPYFSGDLAQAHSERYMVLLQLSRTEAAGSPATVYQRILFNLRIRIPLARDAELNAAIHDAVDKVRTEGFEIAPLGDATGNPETWLDKEDWADAYQTILFGALSRLYAETTKPWASLELAAGVEKQFLAELLLLRSTVSDDPETVYTRLISNLRTQLPLAREATLKLEVYNTADKIRRESLNLPPLTGLNTDPNSWLPEDKWDDCYQAMLHGSLSALYNHTNHPWANPQTAADHLTRYVAEVEQVRAEQATTERVTALDRIVDLARVHLPGSRDAVIKQEFFAVMKEFFTTTNTWTEDIEMCAHSCGGPCCHGCAGTNFEIFPTMGTIVRLMIVKDKDCYPVKARMETPGIITVYDPVKAHGHYVAVVSLTVSDPTNRDGYPRFPAWIIQKYQNALLEGLLYRMMLQPNKPYSNPQMAEYHGKRFRAGMSAAAHEKLRGHVFRGQNWRFPQTFRTSSQRH